MKLLIDGKYIIAFAPSIELGIYDEDFEKWKLSDEEGNLMFYAIDYGYTVADNVDIPSDYVYGKYFYENGEFVLNEDWRPPEPSIEEKVAELERQLANLNGDAVWDEMAVAIEEGVNEV